MDGAEIHESVLTLLAIAREGGEALCVAPNDEQMHVINHVTGQPAEGERRNILTEAARIARGDIKDLAEVSAGDIDALIVPGGFLLGDASAAAAEGNPDQLFSIVDYAYDPTFPNVLGQVFNTDEAAFLAGYLAAGVTKT